MLDTQLILIEGFIGAGKSTTAGYIAAALQRSGYAADLYREYTPENPISSFIVNLLGPRYLHALAMDGYGPRVLARIHPRFRTPVPAIITLGVLSLLLALSGTFVQLALLSVVARLCTYIATSVSVLVLRRRHGDRENALHLPGGALIPIAATLLSIGLLASASIGNLIAGALALLLGLVIYRFRRTPVPGEA